MHECMCALTQWPSNKTVGKSISNSEVMLPALGEPSAVVEASARAGA
jgi:hypothetical protein